MPVLQLTYDDINGLFPWEDGYLAPELQPRWQISSPDQRPHTVSERLEKRAAAFITREAMESASPSAGKTVGRAMDMDRAQGSGPVGQDRSRHRVDPLGEFLVDPAMTRGPDFVQAVSDLAGSTTVCGVYASSGRSGSDRPPRAATAPSHRDLRARCASARSNRCSRGPGPDWGSPPAPCIGSCSRSGH